MPSVTNSDDFNSGELPAFLWIVFTHRTLAVIRFWQIHSGVSMRRSCRFVYETISASMKLEVSLA